MVAPMVPGKGCPWFAFELRSSGVEPRREIAFKADLKILPDFFEAMTAVVSEAEVGIAWTRTLLWRKRAMVRLAVSKRRVVPRDILNLVTPRRVASKGEKERGGILKMREAKKPGDERSKKNIFRDPLYLQEIHPNFEAKKDPPLRQENHHDLITM